MNSLRGVQHVAMQQHGLVTKSDLELAGVTRSQRRTLVAGEQLRLVGRRTYRVGGSPNTNKQRIMAACLDVGGVSSGISAAWLHGMDGFEVARQPEVMVDRSRYDYRHPSAKVHTTTWLPQDDIVSVDGIPCLSVARTLFSLAADVPRRFPSDRVRSAIDTAVAGGQATDPWLWWRLEQLRCRGRNGVRVFEEILSTRAGGSLTESWLERETLRRLAEAGLPTPECQRRIRRDGAFVARVDFVYPWCSTVIEVSGFRWHRTPDQLTQDARRRRQLTLAGFRVLEYSYDDVVQHPDRVVAEVAEALGISRVA